MIEPSLGRTMPMMHFMSVDLPLPLVPSSTTVWPPPILSETSSITRTAPYAAWMLLTVRLLAKVSPFHFRIAHDLGGIAVGDLASGDENDEALREAHHRAHDVLDQGDRNALAVEPHQQRQDFLDLGMGQAGHGFVGDQKFRFRCHGARQLKLAHLD